MLTPPDRSPALLRADDTLLLVVDLQDPFLNTMYERDRLVRNACLLLDAARALRIPVVPTLQNARRMGGLTSEIAARVPQQCVPVDKMTFSCVGSDACFSDIVRSGRRQVLICGLETHICVHQTAHDLLARGFQVHVAADAVASRTQANWEFGLARMERAGVQITTAEMALFEALYEAGTPEFSEVLRLVR
ncbi:MAG TPA: isochorismatase family protein [Chthonomonadales bacterium]|nr:isochorismatase family protein [Chthonomonadales bacterium]